MVNKDKKRAEITTGTIITTVLIIIGFAIIIFIIYQLSWTGRINKDTCHTSVVLRATLPNLAGAKSYVPLKCKTEKICITSGLFGGRCSDYGSEKGITYVKVDDKKQIEQFLTQNIVECWSMMGEGKVSIFSEWLAETYGIGGVYPSCVICSRVAFDQETLTKKGINLGEIDLMDYMKRHLIPNKNITYYDFFAGENAKISVKQEDLIVPGINKTKEGKFEVTSETSGELNYLDQNGLKGIIAEQKNDPVQSKELAILFMQISSPTQGGSLSNIGKTALAGGTGSLILAPGATLSAGKTIGKLCTSGGWVGPTVCGALLVIATGFQQGNVAYNRAITAGYCGDVSVGTEARNGCSVVRTISYNVSDIKDYCSVLENIP